MRLFKNPNQPTVEVSYEQKQFYYGRSQQKIINPWIDIQQALQRCFIPQKIKISCFFFGKKKLTWRDSLKPSSNVFYQIASDMFMIKKSLDILFAASFKEVCVVRLCLELTKHPWYQATELQHQKRKGYQDRGYLSRLQTSQQVAKRLYKIFQMHYPDLYCEMIEADLAKKKYHSPEARSPRTPKTPTSPLGIYPLRYY